MFDVMSLMSRTLVIIPIIIKQNNVPGSRNYPTDLIKRKIIIDAKFKNPTSFHNIYLRDKVCAKWMELQISVFLVLTIYL